MFPIRSSVGLLFLFACHILMCNSVLAQTYQDSVTNNSVRTIYYDKQFKSVPSKEFADYIAYVSAKSEDINNNRFRVLHATSNSLAIDGIYKEIFESDLQKSQFLSYTSYYPNGLKQEYRYDDGHIGRQQTWYENGNPKGLYNALDNKLHGECAEWLENGHIKEHAYFFNGERDGISTSFKEDDHSIIQVEYKNGQPAKPYYTWMSEKGYVAKFKVKDNSPFLEIPSKSKRESFTDKSGTNWQAYLLNGLLLSVSATEINDYGHYYSLSIMLTNGSPQNITIDPSKITAHITKKDKQEGLQVLTASEYNDRIMASQVWMQGFNALAENMAASKAAYSTSVSSTTTSYSGATASATVGAAVGTRGVAVGRAVGASVYGGSVASTTTTQSHDGWAAYQANLIAQNRISNFNMALLNERNAKYAGYLKPNSLAPGETIVGNVNIRHKKGEKVNIQIPIGSVVYEFTWNTDK